MANRCVVSEKCLSCKKCLVVKYVRFDISTFVLLPLHVAHNSVKYLDVEPISAGFFNITKGIAFGHSESLNLESTPNDSFALKVLLNLKEG